jgi:hypothetical protein
VIVRVLGEGQFELADSLADTLNAHDTALTDALSADDESAFRTALRAMLATVRGNGARVPDQVLMPSDVVLPSADATVDDVRDMLGDEGLVPG